MSEKFQLGPGWAAVIVAVAIPTAGGIWYFAGSQAKTETTVAALDKRTEKMEAKLDAIAVKLQVVAPVTATAPMPEIERADGPCRIFDGLPRFAVARPFP